jgi:hypothetical protein
MTGGSYLQCDEHYRATTLKAELCTDAWMPLELATLNLLRHLEMYRAILHPQQQAAEGGT